MCKKAYTNLVIIKSIGDLYTAIFLCNIGNIEDFTKAENLAAYFGVYSFACLNQMITIA